MKDRILNAAEVVFSEKGFHDTKVYQIADKAGVAVGTIYRFFGGKRQLYEEVIKVKLRKFQNEIFRAIEGKGPEQALRTYISTSIDVFTKDEKFFKLFMRDFGSSFPADAEKLKMGRYYKDYIYRLSNVIKNGVEKGIFKPFNPYMIMFFISGGLANVQYMRLKENLDVSTDEIKKSIIKLITEGLKKA